jgi:adenylate cyclase
MLGTYHLNALFEILNKIHFVYEHKKLWLFVLEQACKTVQAEAGTFFEVSEDEKTLRVGTATGISEERLRELPFPMGVGISGWVAQFHQPALVADIRQDNRFNRQVDLVTGFNTRSVLCVPVFSQKRNYGVIEILNRKGGQFSPQDQEFMTLLGRQAAIAYQNLVLVDELSHTKTLLESLLVNLTGGLIAMGTDSKIMILNPSAATILQLPREECVGKGVSVALKNVPWVSKILMDTLSSQATVSRHEANIEVGGEKIQLGYTTILIKDPVGKMLGSGIIFQKLNTSSKAK